MVRRDKENYYLDIAQAVAGRGTCIRRNFGAIIVKNDQILSTGYTGAPRGRKNCSDLGFCLREKMNIPRGERYELDLVLRNNLTTEEHPLGLYHPHAELHHIKKENIGLIEVMGLAVLPARLKAELAAVAEKLADGSDLRVDELTASHADWAEAFAKNYTITKDNAMEIVQKETGLVFAKVLEHAGVYKRTPEGKEAFLRFIEQI